MPGQPLYSFQRVSSRYLGSQNICECAWTWWPTWYFMTWLLWLCKSGTSSAEGTQRIVCCRGLFCSARKIRKYQAKNHWRLHGFHTFKKVTNLVFASQSLLDDTVGTWLQSHCTHCHFWLVFTFQRLLRNFSYGLEIPCEVIFPVFVKTQEGKMAALYLS